MSRFVLMYALSITLNPHLADSVRTVSIASTQTVAKAAARKASVMFESTLVPRTIDPTCPPARCEASAPPTASRSAVLLVGCDPLTDESCRQSLSAAGIDAVISTGKGSLALVLLRANSLFDAVVVGTALSHSETRNLALHIGHRQPSKPTFFVKPARESQPHLAYDCSQEAPESLRSPRVLGRKVSAALVRRGSTHSR